MARPKKDEGKNVGATDLAPDLVSGTNADSELSKEMFEKAKRAVHYSHQIKYIDDLLKVGVDDVGYKKWLLSHREALETKVAEIQAFIYQVKFDASFTVK